MAEKSMNEQMKDFINAIGAVAEMTLLFYRNTLGAGATPEEALRLTQAFIAATIFGNSGQKRSEDS